LGGNRGNLLRGLNSWPDDSSYDRARLAWNR
jgi:hypothetical protein